MGQSSKDGNRGNMVTLRAVHKSLWGLSFALSVVAVSNFADAREVNYAGAEEVVYVTPGEPTQVSFPGKVEGGFKKKISSLALERQDNFLVVFANPSLAPEGEAIIVQLDDKRTYSLRVAPASQEHARDGQVQVYDNRTADLVEEPSETQAAPQAALGYAPPTIVSGLMREMVLVAEKGKQKGIPGYRRSNRFSGEQVLHDGSIVATIDEIFMGPNLWGYVLNVENLLETTQRLNPATFRLDGTRAVTAQNWELSPRPITAEQKISNRHRGKIYIVTRAKRR